MNNPTETDARFGSCRSCQYWEPYDTGGEKMGYCPVFQKATDYNHGAECLSWSQQVPESILKRDPEPNMELSESEQREAMAGTTLIGEITIFMLGFALAALVTILAFAFYKHLHHVV